MLSWEIVKHAIFVVVTHWKQALQLVGVPVLLGVIGRVLIGFLFGLSPNILFFDWAVTPDTSLPGLFLLFIVTMLSSVWIAVLWHRFILLEEYPSGFIPAFPSTHVLAYILQILLFGGFLVAAVLVYTFVGHVLFSGGSRIFLRPGVFVLMLVFLVLLARVLIVLPAIAVGNYLGLRGAWSATSGRTLTIIGAFFILAIVQVLVQAVAHVFAGVPVLSVIVTMIVGLVIIPLLNVSLLTVMYGVFVEEREIG